MTDADPTTTNGQTPATKRRIAVTSYDGNVGTLTFSKELGGETLTLDGEKLSNSGLLAAFGAMTALQNSYANSEDPVGVAKACFEKLSNGTWAPGPPRREAQVDVLTQALIDHLHKETGKLVTPDYISEKYIPAYQERHGLGSVGAARRQLRLHGDLAKRIADIEAARAKATADAVRRTPRESLVLDV